MPDQPPASSSDLVNQFDRLRAIMRQLRTPGTGCAWDLEQDFSTIAPYTIEEAYEVADAIERDDMSDLREELGDLLFQVMFHSQMADEAGHFDVEDVAAAISDKMVARHPHVFGEGDDRDAEAQTIAWEQMKAAERAAKGKSGGPTSALDGVALALPALLRAEKLQKRAARVGFDWPTPEDVFAKLDEEQEEVREAIASGDADAIEDELGDLLFVCANLARKVKIDPEQALRRANAKFERRFKAMEALAAGRSEDFASLDLGEQEALWQAVKAAEKA